MVALRHVRGSLYRAAAFVQPKIKKNVMQTEKERQPRELRLRKKRSL